MAEKLGITLGCDPELFLQDYSAGGIIPACGLIGGTKKEPLLIRDGTYVQEDGVAVEFNTPTRNDPTEFFNQVLGSYRIVSDFVRTKNKDYALRETSSHAFTKEQLSSAQANTLGCDPDALAHDRGRARVPPTIEEIGNERFTGGHVHIGYDKQASGIPPYAMIQLIEAGAYYPFLFGEETQGNRRKFYGLPGLYREKEYGVEYRTPSARWLHHELGGEFITAVFKISKWAANNRTDAQSLWSEVDWDGVKKSIESNKFDLELSDDLVGLFRNHCAL